MSDEDPIEDDWKTIRPDRISRRDPDPPKSYLWVGMTYGDEVRDRICIEVPEPIWCRERNLRGEYSVWTRKFVVFKGHYLPKEPTTIEGISIFVHSEDDTPLAGMVFGGPLIITPTQGYRFSFRVQKPGVLRRAWILNDPDGPTPVLYEDPWDINMDYPHFSPAMDRAITNNLRNGSLANALTTEEVDTLLERASRSASEARFPQHPALDTEEWREFMANSRPVGVL